ncbi:MAG TPA: integrin alpha [Planctomycetota bacterium]|nr:integrin alpha [Planctomycetota bacterium]
MLRCGREDFSTSARPRVRPSLRHVAILAALVLLGPACHREEKTPDNFFDPGDFNADGRADVAVGAPLDDAGGAGANRGRVYVYPGPLSAAPIILNGAEDDARFGFSVGPAGDFNGDGLSDLVVGAPLDDADGDTVDSGDNRGRVFVFLGGTSFPAGIITLNGTEPGGQFGFSVARAGDVDGNGAEDLIVGAPFEDAGGTDRGRAHLFLGGETPSTTPFISFSGTEDQGRFGFAVSSAGLLNTDGFFDWMIGAPGDDSDGDTTSDSGLDRGRVFIYRGSSFPDSTVDTVINGAEDFGELGTSVSDLVDINGDGTDDIVAGAPFEDGDGNTATNVAPFRGRAYLFFGSALAGVSTISSFSASRIFTGVEDGSQFGARVARLGDINSGGADDLFIGAPLDDADGNATDEAVDCGRGFVYFGGAAMDTAADVIIAGTEAGGRLGSWAGSGGDVDADGDRDFAVGAPGDDVDGNLTEDGLNRGRVFFFKGGGAVDGSADASLEGGLENGAEAGTSGA